KPTWQDHVGLYSNRRLKRVPTRTWRDGEIRTRDPLHPMQVRYRTAPRPDPAAMPEHRHRRGRLLTSEEVQGSPGVRAYTGLAGEAHFRSVINRDTLTSGVSSRYT